MKLFARRQSDPLSARTQALSKEIARLEAEIAILADTQPAKGPLPKALPTPVATAPEVAPAGVRTSAPSPSQPTPNDPHFNDLGVRKYDLLSAWRRLTHHLSGPTSNNPKMVHYLAAGSIQGLRPLRYERRVARNRFLAFLALLLLVLWGLAYWSFKR